MDVALYEIKYIKIKLIFLINHSDDQKWAFVHYRMFWGTAKTFIVITYIHHIPYKLPALKYIPL